MLFKSKATCKILFFISVLAQDKEEQVRATEKSIADCNQGILEYFEIQKLMLDKRDVLTILNLYIGKLKDTKFSREL